MQVLPSVSKFCFPSLLLAKRERTEMICHLIQALLCFYLKSVSQERVGDYRANNCFPSLVSLEIFAWTPLDPFPAFLSSFISHFCSSVLITSEPVPLTKLLIFFFICLQFYHSHRQPCTRAADIAASRLAGTARPTCQNHLDHPFLFSFLASIRGRLQQRNVLP